MAELIGSAAKAAYKKASVWGTAVALGAGDQFEYASESVVPAVQLLPSDQITGEALPGPSDQGDFTVSGDLTNMVLLYDGRERFIRDVFGDHGVTAGVTSPDQVHVFDYKTSNQGFFGTLAIDKVVAVHETDSFKPMGLNISAKPGDFVRLTVTGLGRQLFDGDGTNVASSAWTLPSGTSYGTSGKSRQPVRFGHTKLYITEAVSPAPTFPDDYDAYCANEVTLDIKRNFTPTPTTCDGNYSSEPSTDSVDITGTLGFPVYDDANDVLFQHYLAKTVLTGVIVFDSGIALGTSDGNLRIVIWLPAFQLTDPGVPSVGGLGKVPVSFPFRVCNAEFAVDTDAVEPRMYIYNERADVDDFTA